MDIMNVLADATTKAPKTISQFPLGDQFTDAPDELRWRAWWDRDAIGTVNGVVIQCYPVAKVTPSGAWVNQHAYWNGKEWSLPYKELLRWVSNDGGAAWAKPTKALAIDGLIYRHKRWSSRILNDIVYFMDCTETLKEIFPDRADQANSSIAALRHTSTTGSR